MESATERLGELADLEVRSRSIPSYFMYVVLFITIVWATPIYRRFPLQVSVFGALLILTSASGLWLSLKWKSFFPDQKKKWRFLFKLLICALAAIVGVFCAFTASFIELGWTSFFVVLMTCGICAGMVSTLAPNMSLLRYYLALILIPPLFVNLYWVGGLSGYALGIFFGGFLVLLLFEGRLQNELYWTANHNFAQLQAMVEATPGTLTWVSSDLKYLGLNKRLARLLGMDPAKFIGLDVGFGGHGEHLKTFTKGLFKSDLDQNTTEIHVTMDGEPKDFYLVAQKYNLDTEAVIVGLDVTHYKKAQQELAGFKKAIEALKAGQAADSILRDLSTYLENLKNTEI